MRATSEKLTIRPMTAQDVEWAQRLAEGSPQAPHWPQPAYLAATNPESAPRRLALVAETSKIVPKLGRIASKVGFAIACLVGPQAELETIVVAPGVRRSGLGAALMRAMVEQLKTFGATEVTLEVRASNQAAGALYRSLGFDQSGRRPGYYADPVEDAVLMRLGLD